VGYLGDMPEDGWWGLGGQVAGAEEEGMCDGWDGRGGWGWIDERGRSLGGWGGGGGE